MVLLRGGAGLMGVAARRAMLTAGTLPPGTPLATNQDSGTAASFNVTNYVYGNSFILNENLTFTGFRLRTSGSTIGRLALWSRYSETMIAYYDIPSPLSAGTYVFPVAPVNLTLGGQGYMHSFFCPEGTYTYLQGVAPTSSRASYLNSYHYAATTDKNYYPPIYQGPNYMGIVNILAR
jgi:hypothetical protein